MKKSIIFAAIIAACATLFVSCDKGGTTPSPSPSPSPSWTVKLRVDAESSSDIFKFIDFSGSKFEMGGQTVDLSNLNLDKTYNITSETKGSITIVAKPKNFTPADGELYDVVGIIEFYKDGSPVFYKRLGLYGFNYAKEKTKKNPRTMEEIATGWCRRLSANYSFAIGSDGSFSDLGK